MAGNARAHTHPAHATRSSAMAMVLLQLLWLFSISVLCVYEVLFASKTNNTTNYRNRRERRNIFHEQTMQKKNEELVQVFQYLFCIEFIPLRRVNGMLWMVSGGNWPSIECRCNAGFSFARQVDICMFTVCFVERQHFNRSI